MSEIEKMYENAGVKSFKTCEFCTQRSIDCLKENISNITCGLSSDKYPPFTAEKQLNIVKFLLNKSVYYDTYGDREYWFHLSDEIKNSKYREFDEAIAECINKMWEDLRDYEKVQIKEILE
jgi:hypothetical protein